MDWASALDARRSKSSVLGPGFGAKSDPKTIKANYDCHPDHNMMDGLALCKPYQSDIHKYSLITFAKYATPVDDPGFPTGGVGPNTKF